MCTLNQNNTHSQEQLSLQGICFSLWFGKHGNSVIVFRLKRCPLLPEAGGILNQFSSLCLPVFFFLEELYLNCRDLPRARLFWLHAVRKSDSRICKAVHTERPCTYADTVYSGTCMFKHTHKKNFHEANKCMCVCAQMSITGSKTFTQEAM